MGCLSQASGSSHPATHPATRGTSTHPAYASSYVSPAACEGASMPRLSRNAPVQRLTPLFALAGNTKFVSGVAA